MNNSIYILSKSNDPALNLALEEYLIDEGIKCIYLWINNPTIVIGRNQNPYKECNIASILENGVRLMRRRSGGGAVYHDLGNINFTIINDKTPQTIDENFKLVINALELLNIKAEVSGRNDLEVNGKKISGSAFFEEDNLYSHHGTMLVNTNLKSLSKYLAPSKLKLEAKGISSVRARVCNLCDINPKITTTDIVNAFSKILNKEPYSVSEEMLKENPNISKKALKYNSWDWVYGESMEFNTSFTNRFSWGIIELELFIQNGIIKNCRIYTDSIIMDSFDTLEKALKGLRFKKSLIDNAINSSLNNSVLKNDILSMIAI